MASLVTRSSPSLGHSPKFEFTNGGEEVSIYPLAPVIEDRASLEVDCSRRIRSGDGEPESSEDDDDYSSASVTPRGTGSRSRSSTSGSFSMSLLLRRELIRHNRNSFPSATPPV
jgi:hypothetical protein